MYNKIIPTYLLILLLSADVSFSQQEYIPKVFIDCSNCNLNYIKQQITVVNYVLDRKEADIFILFTSQRTASGGKVYTLYMIGQNNFANLNDTLRYLTDQNDTEDLSRKKMVKVLKVGLARYIVELNLSDEINISFTKPQKEVEQKDDWDFWLFRASLSGNFNGQANYKAIYLNGLFFADRTTEDSRVNFSINSSYSENIYIYDNGVEKKEILNLSRSQSFNAYYIKSIDRHCSWGIWGGLNTSTYSNIDISTYISPGIEFNIFPYSVSNERQLRIDYQIKHTYNKYLQKTIFFKTQEKLWSHSLNVTLSLIQPWGNVSLNAVSSNYLNDFNLYDIGISSNLSMELLKGLSINFYGGYSKIQDQISLPFTNGTLEDVLTQNRQIQTNYNYWGGFGISFSFGSLFNNVVNPRFGGA